VRISSPKTSCTECDFVSKSRAGLATHRRRAHLQSRDGAGANGVAVEQTLAELRRLGRVEKIDAARVQALRSMAAALDQNPFNSQMWREYREALGALSADDGDDGTAVDQLIDQLSAPVGDPATTGAGDVRP
jgi:hypothetical protein